jgi:hypothetical protein
MIHLWLNELPLRNDEKEAIRQHEFLLNILNNNPTIFLKENEVLMEKIFNVLTEVYKTKLSNQSLDEYIVFFFNRLQTTETIIKTMFKNFIEKKNIIGSKENQNFYRDFHSLIQ